MLSDATNAPNSQTSTAIKPTTMESLSDHLGYFGEFLSGVEAKLEGSHRGG